MLRFQIGHNFYADSTHPGWGSVRPAADTYDQATGAVFTETALTGLGENVALIGTATEWGAIGRTLSTFAISALRLAVIEIVKTAAYDDAAYAYLEPVIVWGSATANPSWTAAEVALSGLGENIALGGPAWGSLRPSRTLALRVAQIRHFTVEGVIEVAFALPPPQGFEVVGEITAAFTKISGAVQIYGSFECVGEISAAFTLPAATGFVVEGEITATFFTRNGQQAGCISGPDLPAPGRPQNAVH